MGNRSSSSREERSASTSRERSGSVSRDRSGSVSRDRSGSVSSAPSGVKSSGIWHIDEEGRGFFNYACGLDDVPSAWSKSISDNADKLKSLNFNFNSIPQITFPSEHLSHVTRLELASNNLQQLDENLLELSELRILNLRNNQLKSLPSGIKKLTHLQELLVRFNCLTSVPKEIGECGELEVLDLKSNMLNSLPKQMNKLVRLRVMNLEGNQINKLSLDFGCLKSLTKLNFKGNPLWKGENKKDNLEAIRGLDQLALVELSLAGTGVFVEEWTGISTLTFLDFSSNAFSEVPQGVFAMTKLRKLDLSNNQLTVIPDGITRLQDLRKLNLFMNRIKAVPDLSCLIKLEVLIIRMNEIEPSAETQREGTHAIIRYLARKSGNASPQLPRSLAEDEVPLPPPSVPSSGPNLLNSQLKERYADIAKQSVVNVPDLSAATTLSKDELIDKILGVLYGNAIGDAIGLATEFLSKETSSFHYDEPLHYDKIIDDRHRDSWFKGDWTDDTDQMLLILLSIIEKHGAMDHQDFALKLLRWVNHGFPELGDTGGCGCGRSTYNVITQAEYKADAHKAAFIAWNKGGKGNAPNGAVMRTSVLGIPQFHDIDAVITNAKAFAKTTHADPRCLASVVAVDSCIALALQGKFDLNSEEGRAALVEAALELAKKELSEEGHPELESFVRKPSLRFLYLEEGGKIGYTYKTLGAGFYALQAPGDFRRIITDVIMEAGDADTNAAVAGALLGLRFGYSGLPKEWLEGLVHKPWLDQIASKLLSLLEL